MQIIKRRIKVLLPRALLQTSIGAVFIYCVIRAMDTAADSMLVKIIGITSLGASTFIVFARHTSKAARTKSLIGAYIIAMTVGVCCFYIATFFNPELLYAHEILRFEILSAIAFALTMLITIICDMTHPPAVGLSVGLVMHVWQYSSLFIIFSAVVGLAIIQHFLSKWLIDLF